MKRKMTLWSGGSAPVSKPGESIDRSWKAGRRRSIGMMLMLLFCGCVARRPTDRPLNVLVVLVDTLRADRLSLYGHTRPTSPNIDRFARERGVVFENAWANAGATHPSVNSLLTGRWPQNFIRRFDSIGLIIPSDLPTLAERLADHGFDTAAVSASSVVRAAPGRHNRWGGYDSGFRRFHESCQEADAACVNGLAFAELDRLREPFFLYLHYFDPHGPYRPPPGASREFSAGTAQDAALWARVGNIWPIQQRLYHDAKEISFGEPDIRHLSDLYDDEVRYFDEQFGMLIEALERRQLLDSTVVAFVSDHGEELFEHGHFAHGRDLAFETVLATPFVLAVPGVAPGTRETPVSNIDLTPTLLDLTGVDRQHLELDGASLVSLLRRDEISSSHRYLFAAQGRTRAARTRELRVQLDLGDFVPHFERLTDREPALGGQEAGDRALLAALLDWIRKQDPDPVNESLENAAELDRELRAIGYL